MNAYEKLEVHQNPEFKEHLKNIEALEVDLFNKEKILGFAKKYDIMPEDVNILVILIHSIVIPNLTAAIYHTYKSQLLLLKGGEFF